MKLKGNKKQASISSVSNTDDTSKPCVDEKADADIKKTKIDSIKENVNVNVNEEEELKNTQIIEVDELDEEEADERNEEK